MNLLDIAILLIVILITVRGFFRGIVQEATTLLGIVISFFLASYYYGDLVRFLLRYLPGHSLLLGLFSFLVLFGLSVFLFHGFGILLKKIFGFTLLGWVDRIFGGFFGFLKGGLIVFFLVTLLTMILPKTTGLINQSRLFPWVVSLTDRLPLLIPGKIKDDFYEKKKALTDYWEGREAKIKGLQRYPNHEKSR